MKHTKVVQMGFDIQVPSDFPQEELETLFNTLEEKVNNFYDLEGKRHIIKSVGVFIPKDVTKSYIDV